MLAVAFRGFQLYGVPTGLFGGSLASAGFDGGDDIDTVGDPGGEVLDGGYQVVWDVRVGQVEGVSPLFF